MAFHSSIPNKAVIAAVAALTLCAFGSVVGHGWLQFDDPLHVTDNPHFLPVTWSSLCGFWLRPYELLYIPVSYMLFGAECVGSRLIMGGGSCAPLRPDAVFGIALFALAMLAKPQAVTTPLIALGLGIACGKQPVRTVGMALGPWFVLAAAVAFVTRVSQPVDESITPVPLLVRPTVAADAIAWYATKVVLPVGLCAGYGRSPTVVLADRWTPLVAVATAMVLAAIFFLSRFRAARLPAAIFLSALLPVLGFVSFIFQTQSTVADRYAYVAMLGPAAAVCLALGQLCSRGVVGKWLLPATGIGIIGLAAIAARQTSTWRDTGTLARHACRVQPDVAPSWVLLGAHALALKDSQQAVAMSRRGLALDSANVQGWINLGCGLAMDGQPDEAELAFAAARDLASNPRQWIEVHINLGRLLLDSQRNPEAAETFAAVLHRQPRHMAARLGLGVALTRIGALREAAQTFRSVLDDQPGNAAAWVGLGNALFLSNEPGEAVICYGRALSLAPNDAATLANRARAWIKAGDIEAARRDVESLRQRQYPVDDDLSAAVDK